MELTQSDITKIKDALNSDLDQKIQTVAKTTTDKDLKDLSLSMQQYVDGEIAKIRAYVEEQIAKAVKDLEIRTR
jgi:hypothetical protein